MPAQKRIAFSDLVRRVQTGRITEEEIGRYFIRAPASAGQFAPDLAVNELTVNAAGIERVARDAASSLGYQAMEAVGQAALRAQGAPAPDGSIVAEGDSWFNLPELVLLPSIPPTLMDFIALDYPVNNIAHWGDELQQMITAAEYMPYLIKGKVKLFLLSGGGNDVLGGGELAAFLHQRVSGDHDVANTPTYVTPAFYATLDRIESQFRSLIEAVRNVSPHTRILLHGYDYVIPRKGGRALGQPLQMRGFDPLWAKDFARAIIRFLLEAHNARLARLAEDYPNTVTHVDLLGTVAEGEWWDELHPSRAGASRLADTFKAAMRPFL
jgi:hypothetical protein